MANRGAKVSFGSHGLKATTPGRITSNQIESARKAISRALGKTGKVWIRIFPQKSVTKKAAETRMGSGKGNPEYWVAPVKPGTMLFEMEGVSIETSNEAFTLALHKLPVKTRMVRRSELIL